ncbi:hypothetical protein [Burkholderia pyrrocinia]
MPNKTSGIVATEDRRAVRAEARRIRARKSGDDGQSSTMLKEGGRLAALVFAERNGLPPSSGQSPVEWKWALLAIYGHFFGVGQKQFPTVLSHFRYIDPTASTGQAASEKDSPQPNSARVPQGEQPREQSDIQRSPSRPESAAKSNEGFKPVSGLGSTATWVSQQLSSATSGRGRTFLPGVVAAPSAVHAINDSATQRSARAQEMGRNAMGLVQDPASVLSSTEEGSQWKVVSQGASAATRALVWLWNCGGNTTPSGGVDAAPVRTDEPDAPKSEKEKFRQYRDRLFEVLIEPELTESDAQEVNRLISEVISMVEKNPYLGAILDRDSLDFRFESSSYSEFPEIENSLSTLKTSLPDASKIFDMLLEMLCRTDTPEYDEETLIELIEKSTFSSLEKNVALVQHDREHNLIYRIHEFYGLQKAVVRANLDLLLNYWKPKIIDLDNAALIKSLKSVFLSGRLYREEYKRELLEAAKNAIGRTPGLFREFRPADIGRLRAAAEKEDLRTEGLLRDFANQIELCLDPELGATDLSIHYAGYVSTYLRSKYPQHEFLIGNERPIKIRDETGYKSRSGLIEALLSRHTVTMEFPTGTPEVIEDYIRRYQRQTLTHEEADELRKFSRKSDTDEMTRRIQRAGNGTQESLVTQVKSMLPKYGNILDAVSARDIITHERADADESWKSVICDPVELRSLQSRILRLKEVDGLIKKKISSEIMELKNELVPRDSGSWIFDMAAKELFQHLTHLANTPRYTPPSAPRVDVLRKVLVTNEAFMGILARNLVVYLAENGLPKMPEARTFLKDVFEALKNGLSSRIPAPTPVPTPSSSTLIRSEDDLIAWFNPEVHTPSDFVEQWLTVQTQQAGLPGDYRNVSINVFYKIKDPIAPGHMIPHRTTKYNETWKLSDLATGQYEKRKRHERWDELKFSWPAEFPKWLQEKIKGGVWEDYKKFIGKYVESSTFGTSAIIIRLIAQSYAGKKFYELKEGKYQNRPRMVIFHRPHIRAALAGVFELDGQIYSLYNETSYPAPKEYQIARMSQRMIPESLNELVRMGLSEGELDMADNNPTKPWRSITKSMKQGWPYFTYQECEPGEFSRDMMNRYVERFESDMDRATYSNSEKSWGTAAQWLEAGLMLVSLPIGAVTGPVVGAASALISLVPDVIRMAVADTQNEIDDALSGMLLGLLIEVAGQTIPRAMMSAMRKLAKRKAAKLLHDIRSQAEAPVIKLEDLEAWSLGIEKKIKGKTDLSDVEVDELMSGSGASQAVMDNVDGKSWLQDLGYKVSGKYQKPTKAISKGSIGTVYELDDGFIRKDYSGILSESRHGRLIKAENTVAAMNRLYGPGSAEVHIWDSPNPLEKIVTVRMKRIPGESLDSLLKHGDIQGLNDALQSYHGRDAVSELVARLKSNGIDYNDINLANILFDRKTGKFNMVDFDDVNLLKSGEAVNVGKAADMERRFRHYFSEFERSADMVRYKNLDSALKGEGKDRIKYMQEFWGREKYDQLVQAVVQGARKLKTPPKQVEVLIDEFLSREIKKIRHTDKSLRRLRYTGVDIPAVNSSYEEQLADAVDWIIGASNSKTKNLGWEAEIKGLLDTYAKSSQEINFRELEKIKGKLKLDFPDRGLLANNDASYGASATGKRLLKEHLEVVDSFLKFQSANGGFDPDWHARQMLGGILGAHPFGDGNGRLGRFVYSVILLRARKFSRLSLSEENELHRITTRYRREVSRVSFP